MKVVDYLTHLRRALHHGGLSYTAYCIALAVYSERATTIPGLAVLLGLTQKGIRDVIMRRNDHLFTVDHSTRPPRISLSATGTATLAKVATKLPKSKPAREPARRTSNKAQLILDLR